MINAKFNERVGIVATLDPQTVADTETFTDWANVAKGQKVAFVVSLGDMAAETIDVTLYEATDSSGTGAASLKTATQLAAHATNNDNKQITIEVDGEDLSSGNNHVRVGVVTGSTTGGPVSVVGFLLDAKDLFGSDQNLATVVEQVD